MIPQTISFKGVFKTSAAAFLLPLLATSTFGQTPEAPPEKDDMQVIVRFKPSVPDSATDGEVWREGSSTVKVLSKKLKLRAVWVPKGKTVKSFLAQLKKNPRVAYAEPDYLLNLDVTPSDPKFVDQWGLNNIGQTSPSGVAGKIDGDIDAPEGWDLRTFTPVIVAVVDSGVNYNHEDLQSNMWTNLAETPGNGVDDDGNGTVDDVHGINTLAWHLSPAAGEPKDVHGHGTHVSGIIAGAGNNGIGITGVAWNAQIMACRFTKSDGSGKTSDAIEAVDYAVRMGAKVINCSFGGGSPTQSFSDLMAEARDLGVIFVCAAGNNKRANDQTPQYPADYSQPNVISVAASERMDKKASFSNFGQGRVHLFAPGNEIWSAMIKSKSAVPSGDNNGYASWNGTSMAAPHVSGAVALMMAQFPLDPPEMLMNKLLRGTDKLAAFSTSMSSGRLNLAKALTGTNYIPFGDTFSESIGLGKRNGLNVRVNNTYSTKQTGEPVHAGNAGGHSIWLGWSAPANGQATLTTEGSGIDTLLGVYTGASVTGLTLVASNDDAVSGSTHSSVSFPVVAGKAYRIAVDGKDGQQGMVELYLGVPPANDNFTDSIVVEGETLTATGSNLGATAEPGEPNHAGDTATRSIWYRWTAPRDGSFVIDTHGSTFDTLLEIYTGDTLYGLTSVAANDDIDSFDVFPRRVSSEVTVTVTAGTTYQIVIDGWHKAVGTSKLKIKPAL